MSQSFGNISTSNEAASCVLFSSITLANPTTPFYAFGSSNAPDISPSIPSGILATSSTISVQFNITGVGGNPTPTYGIFWGLAGGPYTNQVIGGKFIGNTYFATFPGSSNTNYQCVSFAQNSAGIQKSAPSVVLTTLPSSPNAPSSAPSIPQSNQSTIPPTSITVNFNVAGITGNPTPTYSLLYGTTTNPTTPAPATLALGTLYSATVSGLTAGTTYYFKSVATNSEGTQTSPVSAGIVTSSGSGTAPSGPPTVPIVSGSPTSSSITVTFDVAGITGTPAPQFNALIGTTTSPTTNVSATLVSGTIYQAIATGLSPSTIYYFKSNASNGVSPNAQSAVSSAISTAGSLPQPSLTTLVTLPFIIQGPRFGSTPGAWSGIDYYFSSSATGAVYNVGGTSTQGQQLFGNMYAGTIGAAGNLSGDPGNIVPYAGSCVADQVFNFNFGNTSDAYLTSVRTKMGTKGKMLACLGGFYADVLGLFGPYQPSGFPGTNPTAQQVIQSFLFNYCGITSGNSNPLNWVRQNSNNTSRYNFYFDGLILDFENVGNGNPLNSYPYAPPSGGAPSFPSQATNPVYSPYIAALGIIPSHYYSISPTLFLGNAPVSLSIVADVGQTNICAANTALNTWFAFATATIPPNPSTNPFNAVASSALNHPSQMKYMDDIFVQFYNEGADYYPGGQYFANLLACWGITAIEAQKLNTKKTTINLGLAKGNIIPGGGPPYVANAQGPTPPLNGQSGPPFTLWFPQYCAPQPPNAVDPNQYGLNWPNTGVAKDPKNISDAITSANNIIRTYYSNSSILISDWLSGMGFWAAAAATQTAAAIYNSSNSLSPANVGGTDVLPHKYVYCWGDASYPAPDPLWPANVPIVCTWE